MPMDSLHAIGFYVSAAISVAGGLSVAFLPDRVRRGMALGAVAIGVAGIYLSLSAGFAALIALACYGGCAVLLAGPAYRILESVSHSLWRQLGAIAAGALFLALAYAAYFGDFHRGTYFGGDFGSAAIGRRLFAHDTLAMEAVAALVLVALVGAAAAWRARDRSR
jgi:NADH:ubiquinone oxidoreductase subunit 6 (subunit J)